MAIVCGEGEALMKSNGNPDTLEALGLKPLSIRVRVGALQVLGPREVPS